MEDQAAKSSVADITTLINAAIEAAYKSGKYCRAADVRQEIALSRELRRRVLALEEQVRAALRVYEADKTFNSTSLVMADKLYTGLNALEGRGS